MTTRHWGGLKGPLLIFLAALYFYILAGRIEEIPGQLGPAFWPKAILILLMVSCGIKALEILFSRSPDSAQGGGDLPPAVDYPKLGILIALVIGVVAAMSTLGFLLSNLLFLILFLRVTGVRKISSLLLTSTLGTVFLLYLFVKVVYLPLPKGSWFFDDLTIFIYRTIHLI
jgi:putative tricarboxylic transport membrane protein